MVDGPLGTLMLPNVDRRRQLAGRLARSRDEHLLHLLEHQRQLARAWCPAIPSGNSRHGLGAGHGARGHAASGCGGRRRGGLPERRPAAAARWCGAAVAVAAQRRGARWTRRSARPAVAAVARAAAVSAALTVQGLPLIKPPYGRITALDLNKGELVWQIAHGETPDNIKNHPALKGLTIPRTGRQGRIGVLVTKTLVIAGEGGFVTTPNGQRGAMLRAYDKATGKEVGAVYMPAPQTGSPMTYLLNGRQYITVSISGPGYSAELVTFRLGRNNGRS